MRIRRADGKSVELDMRITAGVGSDHVDLAEAVKRNIDVCEVSFFCHSLSVSEHVVNDDLVPRAKLHPFRSVDRDIRNIADCVQRRMTF